MEYTLDDLAEFTEGLEFAEWLGQENFIKINGVNCRHCGTAMQLRGMNSSFMKKFCGKISLTLS